MGSLDIAAYTAGHYDATPAASFELRANEKDDDLEAPDDYDGMPGMSTARALGDLNVFTASDQDARGQIFWTLRGRTLTTSSSALQSATR